MIKKGRSINMKKQYQSPIWDIIYFKVIDIVCSSGPENFSSYIDGPGDWGDDPIIDPDDDIIW